MIVSPNFCSAIIATARLGLCNVYYDAGIKFILDTAIDDPA